MADHKENVTLHNILSNRCPVCKEDESWLGVYQSHPAILRNHYEYIDLFDKYEAGDDTAEM